MNAEQEEKLQREMKKACRALAGKAVVALVSRVQKTHGPRLHGLVFHDRTIAWVENGVKEGEPGVLRVERRARR